MLAFLPKLAAMLLSSSGAWSGRMTTATLIAANQPRVAPRDPSTLGLAIVGFVTLTVYLAATGWRKSRREQPRGLPSRADECNQEQSIDRSETPTRGAA
jgi:hypothetical protein